MTALAVAESTAPANDTVLSPPGNLALQQNLLLAQRGLLGDPRAQRLLSLSPSTVHIDTALSNFLLAYENRQFIADEALPVVTVSKRSDKIFEFDISTYQQLANVQLAGFRSRPGEIKYSLNQKSYSVSDYGLMDFVSFEEEANADAPLRPRLAAAKILMNVLMLARESRVATLMFGSSNYGSNTSALAGANRWDTATSDPVADLLTAKEACFVEPTHVIFGGQVWPKFQNNPSVKAYITGRAATSGGPVPFLMDEGAVERAFGLKVLVGRAKYNTANEGATPSYSYLWGKSVALVRIEPNPSPRSSSMFGCTFRFGSLVNQVIPDLIPGREGGNYIKVAHSDAEVALAGGNAGYLYTTVIS